MTPRAPFRRPAPWPVIAVAIAAALVWRALAPPLAPDAPMLAFWGFIATLIGWIGTGLEIAGKVIVQALAYSVHLLWAFAVAVKNGFIEFVSGAAKVFRATWRVTRLLYTDVIKPFAQKFWALIDRVRGALERVLKPVFKFLYRVRDELLKFYSRWVRPVLDIIGHVRRVLQVLAALHLDFARKLDAQLARLEQLIDRPFRLVLRKLNEVINIVNRVVTADGLFQRLAYIRTLERDLKFAFNELHNGRQNPLDALARQRLADKNTPPTRAELADNFTRFLETDDGPLAAVTESAELNGTIFEAVTAPR